MEKLRPQVADSRNAHQRATTLANNDLDKINANGVTSRVSDGMLFVNLYLDKRSDGVDQSLSHVEKAMNTLYQLKEVQELPTKALDDYYKKYNLYKANREEFNDLRAEAIDILIERVRNIDGYPIYPTMDGQYMVNPYRGSMSRRDYINRYIQHLLFPQNWHRSDFTRSIMAPFKLGRALKDFVLRAYMVNLGKALTDLPNNRFYTVFNAYSGEPYEDCNEPKPTLTGIENRFALIDL